MTYPLSTIREGMRVLDRNGTRIGSVDWVKMADYDPNDRHTQPVTPDDTGARQDTLLDNLLEAFQTDEVPEQLRESLLRKGFVRVNASGLLASDRYVLPEQVSAVDDDAVVLGVEKSDLIKKN